MVFPWMILVLVVLSGCSTLRCRQTREPECRTGWITVSGTMIPTETVSVDCDGISLAQCLKSSVRFDQNSFGIEDSVVVLVMRNQGNLIAIPWYGVFHSPMGGLWLETGEQVILVRLDELPFVQTTFGDKRVALTGLITESGLLETDQLTVGATIADFAEMVDARTNLVKVTQVIEDLTIQVYFPVRSILARNSSDVPVLEMLDRWGVYDGSVIEFDQLQTSPVIRHSNERRQQAAGSGNFN